MYMFNQCSKTDGAINITIAVFVLGVEDQR